MISNGASKVLVSQGVGQPGRWARLSRRDEAAHVLGFLVGTGLSAAGIVSLRQPWHQR